MARKLPWATRGVKPSRPSKSNALQKTSRKRSQSDSDNDGVEKGSEDELPASSISKPKSGRARFRSPSTSPPPGPPDVEYMRDGFDADDVYMMVEDEFQAIAQTFTHHLHHAEYKRLQRKAREAQRKTLDEPTSDMRPEARKRLEGQLLRSRQAEALKVLSKGSIVSTSSDAEEEETGRAAEPWAGTTLAGLMTDSSPRKRALMGLEQLHSSTRAAKGFERGEANESQQRRIPSVVEIFHSNRSKSKMNYGEGQRDHGEIGRLQSSRRQFQATGSFLHPAPAGPSQVGRPSSNSERLRQVWERGKGLTFLDRLDDFDFDDQNVIADQQSKERKIPESSTDVLAKRKHAKEKEKKARLSEIPTFLV